MAPAKKHELYSLIGDSDSDETAANSVESFEKREAGLVPRPRRDQRRRRDARLAWLRWGVVVVLQTAMMFLLAWRTNFTCPSQSASKPVLSAGGDINGLYVENEHDYRRLKFEDELYMPNMTSNDDRDAVRRRWDKLMPLGSGSVSIRNHKDYPLLGPPIADDPLRSGPLYEASWTHALHCLYYSVDSYHQLIVNGRTGDENPHHASHCFEYLRTSILCNLDMTLEGSYSANRESGGQAHVCRSRDQAVRWIEDHRVDDAQDIIGP